jgi:hypothetical protein
MAFSSCFVILIEKGLPGKPVDGVWNEPIFNLLTKLEIPVQTPSIIMQIVGCTIVYVAVYFVVCVTFNCFYSIVIRSFFLIVIINIAIIIIIVLVIIAIIIIIIIIAIINEAPVYAAPRPPTSDPDILIIGADINMDIIAVTVSSFTVIIALLSVVGSRLEKEEE